ncbi:metallophosphoesterase family protein [Roseicyclus marinus]|uniref:Phosphoesterase n=1 Tax=Roseicyclus marinus TaxID=2161673 RepID=A0AA48KN42_9RHOB|nr:phosphodiesterase [Roseicyclus marinus]
MKILVLSDIHGNATALEAVLRAAASRGAEHIINAGDLIGYYHQPERVLSLLAEWPMDCVRGNHENMLQRAIKDPAFLADCTARYGSGLARAIEWLRPAQIEWLLDLPAITQFQRGRFRVLLAHGTPKDVDEYLYPDASEEKLEQVEAACGQGVDLLVLGHTHYQKLWDRSALRILNPGSVGQPRDRVPGAAWALLDTESGEIDLYRQAYDSVPVADAARRLDPAQPYLWTVLERR